jgi:hypothetical protein
LNESRGVGDITERRTQFPDDVIDALLEINERVAAPERTLDIDS